MTIFELPYLFISSEHQHKVYNSEIGEEIAKLLEKHGFVAIQYLEMGARNITNSKRPIVIPEDLKGLKLRVPDTKASIDALGAMGAAPTPMAFSELYMALQQKVVDGQENPFANIYSAKFYEVQKYLTLSGHQRLEQLVLFSRDKWNKMPREYKDAIMEAAVEANTYIQGIVAEGDTTLLNKLKEEGMEVNEVDQNAFIEVVKPLKQKYIEEYGQKAKEFFDKIESKK